MKRLIMCVVLSSIVFTLAADSRTDEIMRKALELQKTDDMAATVYMVLREKDGTTTTRKLNMYTQNTAAGVNSFVEFLSPADVKGTRFLSRAVASGNDDQRLWLPELGKVRKIATSGKDGKFMGSDLTYYDMEDRDFTDSRYEQTGNGSVVATKDGRKQEIACHIIKGTPVDDASPYGYVLTWVGEQDSFIYKSEMYAQDGKKIKTVYITEANTVNGLLLPIKTLVAAEDGHKTLMYMEDLKVNSGLDADLFTIRNLQR